MKRTLIITIILLSAINLFPQDQAGTLKEKIETEIKKGKYGYIQFIFTEPVNLLAKDSLVFPFYDLETGRLLESYWSLTLYINNELYINDGKFRSGSEYIIAAPAGNIEIKYYLNNYGFKTGTSRWRYNVTEKKITVTVQESKITELRIVNHEDCNVGMQIVGGAAASDKGIMVIVLPFPIIQYDVNFETVNEKNKLATVSCKKYTRYFERKDPFIGKTGSFLDKYFIDETNSFIDKYIAGKEQYTEELLITRIDSEDVGNFENGWPLFVYAEDGKRTIEVRHNQPWKLKKYWSLAQALGPEGRKKDAIMSDKKNTHTHYRLSFDVIKGHKYTIGLKNNDNNSDEPEFFIVDEITKNEIPFDKVRIIIDPKPAEGLKLF